MRKDPPHLEFEDFRSGTQEPLRCPALLDSRLRIRVRGRLRGNDGGLAKVSLGGGVECVQTREANEMPKIWQLHGISRDRLRSRLLDRLVEVTVWTN